jgi:hypothetical protein
MHLPKKSTQGSILDEIIMDKASLSFSGAKTLVR